ncbi:GNAT family N-acetyltransferase [Paenibacillus sp. RC67]|uniref:GNAT family N-acetyltransferase n=1 Tax=Paenibacillus sp. RC67 TaxID=3039392 RepID=UPI0024AD77E3|nr:GNAT family N-acetyltransferase [Paenibacillus sp. RC67]
MNIRFFQQSDSAQVQTIMSEHTLQFPKFVVRQYPGRWDAFLTSMDLSKNGYYVAFDTDGALLGHAGYLFNELMGLYEIVGVVVRIDRQGQGIGKAMLETICLAIAEFGEKQVVLFTLGHSGNEATIAFYQHNGYEMINVEHDFYRTDFHRVTFTKQL